MTDRPRIPTLHQFKIPIWTRLRRFLARNLVRITWITLYGSMAVLWGFVIYAYFSIYGMPK